MALFLHALWGGGKPLALLLTIVLLCVLRPGGQPKEKEEPSSMADVYNHELTPLQKHVAFFDRNKDGVIHPSETYEGTYLRGGHTAHSHSLYSRNHTRNGTVRSGLLSRSKTDDAVGWVCRVPRDRVRRRAVRLQRRLHQRTARSQDHTGMHAKKPLCFSVFLFLSMIDLSVHD